MDIGPEIRTQKLRTCSNVKSTLKTAYSRITCERIHRLGACCFINRIIKFKRTNVFLLLLFIEHLNWNAIHLHDNKISKRNVYTEHNSPSHNPQTRELLRGGKKCYRTNSSYQHIHISTLRTVTKHLAKMKCLLVLAEEARAGDICYCRRVSLWHIIKVL